MKFNPADGAQAPDCATVFVINELIITTNNKQIVRFMFFPSAGNHTLGLTVASTIANEGIMARDNEEILLADELC